MKRLFIGILGCLACMMVQAQEYYPEGTKWTEIRLDTLKYDSWYSKVGTEWVPNFETIEYYVKGEYVETGVDDPYTYRKVYTNGPEWTDSLTLLIREENDNIWVSVMGQYYEEGIRPMWPGLAYQFDWSVGQGVYFTDILMSNTTYIVQYHCYYGIIDEIKEGDFGGVRPLKYVDLDGKAPACGQYDNPQNVDTQGGRIIQGIGITEWNGGECLFGAPRPSEAAAIFSNLGFQPDNYRSMLVRFERGGEVLYDVWPEKGATDDIQPAGKAVVSGASTSYDLQGRQLDDRSHKGIHIQNGKKYVVKGCL